MDNSKHSGVISLFNQHLIKTGILSINCSKIIQESKNFREKADYADYVVVDKEVAEKQLENAKTFIQEIEMKLEEIV